MSDEVFIGVDPGASGAIAAIDTKGDPIAWLPTADPHGIWHAARDEWQSFNVRLCVIELVSAMPKQGVSSTFKFGWSAGVLEGLIIGCGWRYERIRPAHWQKVLGCRSGGDKNVTKCRASQLFPSLKMTHTNSDAFLLAEYARRSEASRGVHQ